MSETSTRTALERLERAIGRVERAVSAGAKSRDAAFAQLDSRHTKLRAKAQDTIAELDRVIADAAVQSTSATQGNGALQSEAVA